MEGYSGEVFCSEETAAKRTLQKLFYLQNYCQDGSAAVHYNTEATVFVTREQKMLPKVVT
jgi:hypothetical protein